MTSAPATLAAGADLMRGFRQVDVFGSGASRTSGNPVAVVHDADALDDAAMAAFARWTNLSETTFLLTPTEAGRAGGADYRLRIWTPGGELPFAGHPTLGSAHAWLEAGGTPAHPGEVVQECGVGFVPLRRDEAGELSFAAPPLLRSGPVDDADLARIARALRLEVAEIRDAAWIDNGPGWVGVLLADADAVLALEPDPAAFDGLDIGVAGLHGVGHDAAVEVRAFVPGLGVPEDPVTGSLNAGIAQWLGGSVLPPDYIAAQGTVLGRAGRVRIATVDGQVWVGGRTITTLAGTARLP